jgi:oligopeptide transport system permease protein
MTETDDKKRDGSLKGDKDQKKEYDLVEGTSLWSDAWQRLLKNKAAMTGAAIVAFMAMAAVGYEGIVKYGIHFTLAEQHPFVVPKPPGARSVPSNHYSLMDPDGKWNFQKVDQNGDGLIGRRELQDVYRKIEFNTIDTDGNNKLDYEEYRAAPLSVDPPSDNIPDCQKWKMINKSLAPIEAKSIFNCEAGKDGYIEYDDAGKLIHLVSVGEARNLIAEWDKDGDSFLSEKEFQGLPKPETHHLGTDQLGRDLLSRLIFGARISLAVGIIATLVSLIIGVTWGATAGYMGGKIDNLMMRIVDILYGIPFMILVILLVSVFGSNIYILFVALGAIQWLTMARIVRGQVISLKNEEFVDAARSIGTSNVAIVFRHLIPNALGPIIVYTTLTVPAVMLQEAFLSFLGLGIRAPLTSWGALASQGRRLMGTAPWLIFWPGLALAVTLLSLNFLGDGLRDALDPQLKED